MNNNNNNNNIEEEVVVAQCLISMSKDSSDYEPPQAQWEDPSLVSDEEFHAVDFDRKIEIHNSSSRTTTTTTTTDTSSMRSYSYDNMIPTNALPSPNQWENDKHLSVPVQCEITQVWDSTKGADSREVKFLESIITHERKEKALALFHENEYHMSGILDKVMERSHDSEWPDEAKTLFSSSITKADKNFASIARRLNKTTSDCQKYYYSKFKRTGEYLRMKRALRRSIKTRSSDVALSTTFGGDK